MEYQESIDISESSTGDDGRLRHISIMLVRATHDSTFGEERITQ
jgi:hypothetical protein